MSDITWDLLGSDYLEPTYDLRGPNQSWALADNEVVHVEGAFANDSTNNHWRPLKGRKGTGMTDIGSNWTAVKSRFEPSTEYIHSLHHHSGGTYHGYKGPVMVNHDSHFHSEHFLAFMDDFAHSIPELYALGSTAISRVIPTNPVSDLPTGIAEIIREGFPRFPGSRATRKGNVAASAGSNYLNYEFGIRPFIRELQAFSAAVGKSEKIIDDYASRAGKKLRRRFDFDPVHEVLDFTHPTNEGYNIVLAGPGQSSVSGYMTPVLGGWPGERRDVNTRTRKTWFSGAFVYYLPFAGNDFSSKLLRQEAELRRLYGGISVDTAWNLIPYSWAVDWFTNAGDVIHNVAAFARDGLVMPHAYIMESCESIDVRTVSGAVFGRTVGYPGDPLYTLPNVISTTFGTTLLRRRKATPYGFGLDEDGFTLRQKSILIALGVSRLKR